MTSGKGDRCEPVLWDRERFHGVEMEVGSICQKLKLCSAQWRGGGVGCPEDVPPGRVPPPICKTIPTIPVREPSRKQRLKRKGRRRKVTVASGPPLT